MRSIPLAIMWELLYRSRWLIPLGIVGANWLPISLLMLLRIDGLVDGNDPAYWNMQAMLTLMGNLTFGAVFLSVHDCWRRCYTLPVRTSTLVACRMFPMMVVVSLQSAISTSLVNYLFNLNWPIWGPALFAVVFIAAIQAALLFADESWLVPGCLAIASAIPGLWYKSRCGPLFGQVTHVWREVTFSDAATLALFTAVAYAVAVGSVARNRRGERAGWRGSFDSIHSLFERQQDLAEPNSPRFGTPLEAHRWRVEREVGWQLPTCTVLVLGIGYAVWFLFGRDGEGLLQGLLIGGAVLFFLVGLFGGICFGNCGGADRSGAIGHFLGTRPISNRDLSSIILSVAARSLLTSLAIWIVAFITTLGVLCVTGSLPDAKNLVYVKWWHFPGAIICCWIIAGASMSVAMTGRSAMLAVIIQSGVVASIMWMTIARFLSIDFRSWIEAAALVTLGMTCLATSLVLIIAAKRQLLITSKTLAILCSVWGMISIPVLVECLRQPSIQIPLAICLIGLTSWAVAPIAAAPLALTWNRHR